MRIPGFVAAGIAILAAQASAKLYCEVPSSGEVCFMEDVEAGAPGLRGSLEVLAGGNMDIDVMVFVQNKVVLSLEKVNQHDFDVRKGSGRYKVCFGNRFSTIATKSVAFSLHGAVGELIEDEEVAKHSQVPPLERMVEILAEKVQKLHEHQEYLLARMSHHVETSHKVQVRVMMSTGIEAGILILVNTMQVLYLKRYIERRRKI